MSLNSTQKVERSGMSLNRDEVARTAYLLWEKEGRIPHREVEYWLRAEAQLVEAQKKEIDLVKASSKLTAVTEKPALKKKSGKESVYA